MARSAPPDPSLAWAFFLDVDGTLLDLAATPSAVRLLPRTRALVRALHERTGGALALVTGRSIADIDAIFGAPPLPVAGQHGLDRRGAPDPGAFSSLGREAFGAARTRLRRFVDRHSGLLLEDKGASLAIHYRSAPALAGVAHRVVRAEQMLLGASHRVQRGKRVVELRPSAGDKGEAIDAFMRVSPFIGRTPTFIGDDVTDEDGFIRVNAMGGHSVRVGGGTSAARWRLRDPRDVVAWLERALTPVDG